MTQASPLAKAHRRIRTLNTLFTKQALCYLSYAGENGIGGSRILISSLQDWHTPVVLRPQIFYQGRQI